ncbi:hypothetical protein PAXRUDRAFT_600632 [Paxillus rubicundulus Ve08.2h10]|uniref:Uncharacterized protein n=1 Tax=Paxillus rubicundulus Ve08.2h10 TaxID=930991 RepID=A0A0D0EDA4_9AGAM|nr:hypothetical protein PAXRUDRAFT_600632 [Paxillus rubicundulus Ve08.2h10]
MTCQCKRRVLTAAPCLECGRPYHLQSALNVRCEEETHPHQLPVVPPSANVAIMMTFPLFSRFRRPGPPLDNRGQHLQRPPPITHVPRHHLGLVPQVHRGHHRHQSSLVPVPRLPTFWRRDSPRPSPQIRARPSQQIRAQPKPPGRPPMNCLHIHFHGTPKPHRGAPAPRPSKNGYKQLHHSSHKDPQALSRHVHWVPPQQAQRQSHSASHGPSRGASHTSSRGPAHAPARAPAPVPSHAAPQAAPRAPSHAAPRAPSHAAPRAPSHAAPRIPSHAAATHTPSHAPASARSNGQPRQPSNPPPDPRPQQARSSHGVLQRRK